MLRKARSIVVTSNDCSKIAVDAVARTHAIAPPGMIGEKRSQDTGRHEGFRSSANCLSYRRYSA